MIKKIKTLLEDGVKEKAYPGGQFCLVTKTEIKCEYFGYKSYEPLTKCDGSEVYDVASLTKVISTTTLIMKLIEDGLLSLETKASSILPRLRHDDISIYDLLIHSSGLPSDIPRSNQIKSKEELLDLLYAFDPIYEKYEKVVYSDAGYILLGLIVEKLYGMPIDEAAEKVIFNKLEMTDSNYKPDISRAAPTEKREDRIYEGLLTGKVHDEKSFIMGGLAGHAGLFSTAKDIAKFIQSILNKDFVLENKTLDEIFKSRIIKEGRWGLANRSLGWDKPTDDYDKVIMHTGFTGCNMWIDLNIDKGFVLLTNGVHPKRENNNVFPYRNQIRKYFTQTREE